jgi:hypothetical protein
MASKYFERVGLRVGFIEKRKYGLMVAYERMTAFLFSFSASRNL